MSATLPRATGRVPGARVVAGVTAAVLVAALAFEVGKHGGWTWFAAVMGMLGPDLSFLPAIGDTGPHRHGVLPARAVPAYNALHRLWPPLVLLTVTVLLAWPTPLFVLGLAWLTHLALDRAFGYGLRAKDGTRLTMVRMPVEPVSPARVSAAERSA